MFTFEFWFEVFGYIGTALVVISMLMTSVVRLRIINICGSVISLIYSLLLEEPALPLAVMNALLIIINLVHLIGMFKNKTIIKYVTGNASDASVRNFIELYRADIENYFPENISQIKPECQAHLAFCGTELVGVILGKRYENEFEILIDYAEPRFRDLTVSQFLYAQLKESGVEKLYATESEKYFAQMGFIGKNRFYKSL